ncbi:Thioesterase super [Bacillus thuringiensis serovar huazhongensis BGSC 4BD1]|nr:Thioesterase super [Bacillus thuringiensis serovar huazhongensis BGSC 4BD1]
MKTIEQSELSTNQMTVGYAHEMKHLAATPMGHTINIESELVEVSGKKLIFKVVGYDFHDKVVEGYHTRFIIDKEKFLKNLAQKELVK